MAENEKQDLHENQSDSFSKNLRDEELEGVDGGFFDITIIDSCEKRWNRGLCSEAIWGTCPNLVNTHSETTPFEYKDVYNCKKGYFNSVTVIRPAMGNNV